jgi:hypothetical protein
MTLPFVIRSPQRDEWRRLAPLVPRGARTITSRVAVVGRVERIAAATVLYRVAAAPRGIAHLAFTRSPAVEAETVFALIESVIADAAAADAGDDVAEIVIVGSIATDQALHQLLSGAAFEAHRQVDVYRMQIGALQARIESIYQRLAARGTIPADAHVISPHGDWIMKLRTFLDTEKPGLSERLDVDVEGFALEHSLMLVVGDAVKGVLFTRNRGRESFIGLILIAHELRGGFAWANTFLMREVLLDGMASGVESVVFEVHAEDHRGTLQIARAAEAERVARRSQFRVKIDSWSAHPH